MIISSYWVVFFLQGQLPSIALWMGCINYNCSYSLVCVGRVASSYWVFFFYKGHIATIGKLLGFLLY